MYNIQSIFRLHALNTIYNKIERQYNNKIKAKEVLRQQECIDLQSEINLITIGYTHRDSNIIVKYLYPKKINKLEKKFDCDLDKKKAMKKNLPEMYKKIIVSRYKRLYNLLLN